MIKYLTMTWLAAFVALVRAEGGKALISFSGTVLTDFAQNLGPNDKSSKLVVSEVTFNTEAELSPLATASLGLIAEVNMGEIEFEEASIGFAFTQDSPMSLRVGQTLLPFGLLNTHLISDPAILDAEEIEVETIEPAIMAAWEPGKFGIQAGFYKTDNMEAGVIKAYAVPKEGIRLEASTRLLPQEAVDIDAALELMLLNDKLTIDGEFFMAAARDSGAAKPLGFLAGIAFQAMEPLEVAARLDGIRADTDADLNLLIAMGGTYSLKNGIFMAMEYNYAVALENQSITLQTGIKF